jgi:Fe-S-cluster-containing dehydrogenase component
MGPFGEFPDLSMYFLPVMCQQCKNPACARVCPTGACAKSPEDGVVYIDAGLCVGCQSCIRACPYKANFLNGEMRVSDKCDICKSRRDAGKIPVCVRNCAGNCLHFGDMEDPESDVSRRMRDAGSEHVRSLRSEAGCEPSGRFILRKAKWVDPSW